MKRKPDALLNSNFKSDVAFKRWPSLNEQKGQSLYIYSHHSIKEIIPKLSLFYDPALLKLETVKFCEGKPHQDNNIFRHFLF